VAAEAVRDIAMAKGYPTVENVSWADKRMWSLFERMFGRRPAGEGWDLRVEGQGRGGRIIYLEGTNRIDFDFELGDACTIYCPPAADWEQTFPWAAGRRREIMERVASEFVRREFRGYTFEIGGAVIRPRAGSDGKFVGFDAAQSDDVIFIRKRAA
jgi:hypothetical protein